MAISVDVNLDFGYDFNYTLNCVQLVINKYICISLQEVNPRTEILHNIDPSAPDTGVNEYPNIFDTRVLAALRMGPWKIATGKTGK